MFKYSFSDYEEAYFKEDVVQCRIIGLYLLQKIAGDKSKELYHKLFNLQYEWDMPQDKLQKVYQLLAEVRHWLRANL